MPVSKEPSYAGCGGAMGPAQFLPTTWLLYEKRVAELTGHNPPNPWNVEDAFTAAALFLADRGAASKTVAGETSAAKAYISGSQSCNRYVCRSYASRIISLARDIENTL
jgi:membrane-bound lytic murein transglycosylase B